MFREARRCTIHLWWFPRYTQNTLSWTCKNSNLIIKNKCHNLTLQKMPFNKVLYFDEVLSPQPLFVLNGKACKFCDCWYHPENCQRIYEFAHVFSWSGISLILAFVCINALEFLYLQSFYFTWYGRAYWNGSSLTKMWMKIYSMWY